MRVHITPSMRWLFSYNHTARRFHFSLNPTELIKQSNHHEWNHVLDLENPYSEEFLRYPSLKFASIFLKPSCISTITRPLVQFRRAAEKVEPGPNMPLEWLIQPHSTACTSCIELHIAFGCLKREATGVMQLCRFFAQTCMTHKTHSWFMPSVSPLNSQKILIYYFYNNITTSLPRSFYLNKGHSSQLYLSNNLQY